MAKTLKRKWLDKDQTPGILVMVEDARKEADLYKNLYLAERERKRLEPCPLCKLLNIFRKESK